MAKKFVPNNNDFAIAYYRFSSHAQSDASIQQREAAQKYAAGHGLQIIKEYKEMKIANLIQFESLNTQEIGRNKGLLTYSTMSEAFIFLQSSMRKKIRGFKC